jgi:hypothetical protein
MDVIGAPVLMTEDASTVKSAAAKGATAYGVASTEYVSKK